jgi:hypothetical protein
MDRTYKGKMYIRELNMLVELDHGRDPTSRYHGPSAGAMSKTKMNRYEKVPGFLQPKKKKHRTEKKKSQRTEDGKRAKPGIFLDLIQFKTVASTGGAPGIKPRRKGLRLRSIQLALSMGRRKNRKIRSEETLRERQENSKGKKELRHQERGN